MSESAARGAAIHYAEITMNHHQLPVALSRVLCGALGALALTSVAGADVRLPTVLGDNMVLQQGRTASIWGWADAGEPVEVTCSWMAAPVSVKAGADGTWKAQVQTPDWKAVGNGKPVDAFKPQTITIKGKNTITLKNVLIGEVWICSGQSNMEWGVAGSENPEQAIKGATQGNIRLFNVRKTMAATPATDCVADSMGGKPAGWVECSPETVPGFSAVGYFFGRELLENVKVPIGLIGSNWGGTPAEAWTTEGTIGKFPEFADAQKTVKSIASMPPGEVPPEQGTPAWWAKVPKLDPGTQNAEKPLWAQPGFDDSKWGMSTLPTAWAGDLADFDGIVWYRRAIEFPASMVGKDLVLSLGPIDDADTTYLDGVMVGATEADGQWNVPRMYTIPAAKAIAGKHVIAIRVCDFQGIGGVNGKAEQMFLSVKGGSNTERVALDGYWRFEKGADMAKLRGGPARAQLNPGMPSVLFNGMIAPLANLGVRGAIWYQGESNVGRAPQYAKLFPAMIQDWRATFKTELAFGFVQIAPYTYGNPTSASELREAQAAALQLPMTGMAVTMDIGNAKDIHPRNKLDVGHRLAVWALATSYGQSGVVWGGPTFDSMKAAGGNITLKFNHASGMKVATGKTLAVTGFEAAGADGKFVPVNATIEGESVSLVIPAGMTITQVRYGWCDGCENLTPVLNGAGLPMVPFRTEVKK